MTPTEPTVEKPQIAVPPSLVGSADECKTRGNPELSCEPIRHRSSAVSLESNGCRIDKESKSNLSNRGSRVKRY